MLRRLRPLTSKSVIFSAPLSVSFGHIHFAPRCHTLLPPPALAIANHSKHPLLSFPTKLYEPARLLGLVLNLVATSFLTHPPANATSSAKPRLATHYIVPNASHHLLCILSGNFTDPPETGAALWDAILAFFSASLSAPTVRNAIAALPGISITTIVECAYSTEDYLTAAQPLVNASTNIYIIIIPNGIYLRRFIASAALSGGFFTGPKAYFYMSPDVATATAYVPQGGVFFARTDGTAQNVTAWKVRASQWTQPGAATTYDSVTALAHAITRLKNAGTAVTRANVLAEFSNTNERGYSGPLSYDAEDRYRSVQTYNLTNVVSVSATTQARVVRNAFTWDGALSVAAPMVWPGSATVPTTGNVTVYPVGFISAQYDNYSVMVNNDNVVPLTVSQHRLVTRLASATVNNLILTPLGCQISVPPLNDNGTISGAVRISTTISQTTYVAMLATWDSPNTRIIQGVLSAYNVPQISYSASDPTLSSKDTYPTLVRVNPSDAKQIKSILEMIKHFGWAQVSTISTSSAYGQGLDQSFSDQLAAYPEIDLGRSLVVPEDGAGLTEGLKLFQNANINIVILLVEPKLYAVIHKTFTDLEYAPRAVVVPDRFFTPYLWQHKLVNTTLTISDFAGWVGVIPAAGNYAGSRFDYLQEVIANATASPALGYTGLAAAFAQSPDYVAYIFDSFYVVADAIARCLAAGEDPKSGTSMLKFLKQIDVNAATGPLNFDANSDRRFNPFVARYVTNNGTFETFAAWDEETGFVQSTRVVWPDGTTNVPIAIEPRTVKWLFWHGAAGIVLAAFAGAGLLLCVAMTILVVVWRESPVIVSSTYPFLLLIMFGGALGFGSMFTWIGEPASWICALRIWLPPIAFTLMVAPLLAKTWRLHRIFTLASLKTTPIPLWKLILMVVCITLIQVGICVAWISAGTIQPTTINDKHDPKSAYKICAGNQANRIASYVTYGYLGLLLLVGAYYAFRVRSLPKDFNESRWIGFSIYNTLLFSVIIVILGYALADFRVTVLILICVCTLAIVFGVIGLMMAPKLWTLIMNPHRRTSSGSGTLTYSGPNSSPHGSKYQTSFRSEHGSATQYADETANGTSGSTNGRRHDFTRKRGEPSAHSKESSKGSKDRETEMKPLNNGDSKRSSKKTEAKTSATSSTSS